MILRQLFDYETWTYTYLLADESTSKAILIDPVIDQVEREIKLLDELGLELVYTLDTHAHADHITGSGLLRARLGSKTVVGADAGVVGADVLVQDGSTLRAGDLELEVRATPGHTDGCVTFVTADHKHAFVGDSLFVRGTGRTDFQQGDPQQLYKSIRDKIFSLPDDCLIYPGHDYHGRTVSTVGEERQFNPRIGGDAREEDFVGYMDNLGLPHPKLIDIAVPANLHSGRPDMETASEDISWGPVTLTFAGIPEVQPEWVARHTGELFILDVRSPSEFGGELGHLEGSTLIPLDELRERLDDVPRDRPVVAVCQSGKRSAKVSAVRCPA